MFIQFSPREQHDDITTYRQGAGHLNRHNTLRFFADRAAKKVALRAVAIENALFVMCLRGGRAE
jgi:hypothetical protein